MDILEMAMLKKMAGKGGSYVLELTAMSGELTDEQYNAVVANAPNVILAYDIYRIPLLGVYEGGEFEFAADIIIGDGLVVSFQGYIRADKSYELSMLEHEFATKTYVDDAVANAGGGGASGGLSIKKITFTDRPTAQNWFVENSGKVLRAEVAFFDQRFSFTNINLIDEYDIPSAAFTEFIYELDNGNVSIAALELRITQNGVRYSGGTLGNEPTETEIPDEQWEVVGFKVTVYYID